jgi:hypothetical protein
MCFVDEQHGWYAGYDGHNSVIWKTTDGGVTLKRQSAHVAAGGGYPDAAPRASQRACAFAGFADRPHVLEDVVDDARPRPRHQLAQRR